MTPARVLATELRDTLLQDLIAVTMMLQTTKRRLDPDSPEVSELENARGILRDDLVRLRAIITHLGPPA